MHSSSEPSSSSSTSAQCADVHTLACCRHAKGVARSADACASLLPLRRACDDGCPSEQSAAHARVPWHHERRALGALLAVDEEVAVVARKK